MIKLFLLAVWASAVLPASAEPSRIYLANDDHTDFMWTADADTYANVFVEMLDWHLKLADETAGNESPYRNRFNTDGSYWLWNYEQKKPKADFEKLIGRIKDGSISSPLNTLVSCYGGQPVEAVLRGMYYAGRLERRYDMRFPIATAMENQTLPLGLASLFAGSGAKYSWRGVCACASKLDKKVLSSRPREVYRWTGKDDQSLLLKWYSVGPHNVGTYLEAGASPWAAIKYVETNPGFVARHVDPQTREPFKVLGLFGYGGDDLARKTGVEPPPAIPGVPGLQHVISSAKCDHFHNIAKQMTTPARQVISSNQLDYFEDFEKTHGASLESQSVTYGNEWDLYSASMSETSARVKRAVEKLRPAELLAAMVSLKYPGFMKNHAAARDRAFNNLGLYWEHNWTADGPVSPPHRAAWQEEVATLIEGYVQGLQAEAIVRLGGMIPRPEKAQRFFVFNPLGWVRTDAADFAWSGSQNIHVRDLTTAKDVPHQFVKIQGAARLRILAPDVPSAGYKVFEIHYDGKGGAPTDAAATFAENVLENDAVKLVIERDGAIRSFTDKKRGKELAGDIFDFKLNDIAAKSDEGEALRLENSGPVSVTVRARSEAGLEHDTFVTLYRNSDRIDIHNEIRANFSDVRYWAFTFALKNPSLHTEEVGAINLNKLASDGGDYADSHARYDHITVNHFADMTDGDGKSGVTISNPDLAFAKMGGSEIQMLDTSTPQLNMLAGGQIDGSWLGIPAQNGNSRFTQRFALRPHGNYDQVAAMKFALEHQNPLVTGEVISKGGSDYPEKSHSLLTISNPDVLLWALKPHDDGIGKGLTARFWNVSDRNSTAEVSLTPAVASAFRTTHIETDLEPIALTGQSSLTVAFKRQQIQTYRIELRK